VIDERDAVVGYFAIALHVLDRGDASKKLGRGVPRQIPAILLAKLALSADLHRQGLGAELLVRALGTIIDAARAAGGCGLPTSRCRGASASS
jgi:GNAT superfamily N-acetyltransferase